MDSRELIKHILGNSEAYLEDYSKKEKLSENEKGILHGLWMDVDSIKNHLEMERLDDNKEAAELEKELRLDELMEKLENLFQKK